MPPHQLDAGELYHDFTTLRAMPRFEPVEGQRMTGDTTKESTRRRPRIRRRFAMTCVLVVALGAGWIAGLKTRETTDIAQLSSAAWAKLADLGSLIETSRMRLSATPQGQTTDRQTPPKSSTTTERARFVAREIEGISLKLDQGHASSEAAVESLRDTLNKSCPRSRVINGHSRPN